jgi:hypothetical protein
MSLIEVISVDSAGWIERFTKGPKALKYKRVIESSKPEEIVTSVVVLYEVYKKIKKLKGEEEALLAVAALSQTDYILFPCAIRLGKKEGSENQKYACPLVPGFSLYRPDRYWAWKRRS